MELEEKTKQDVKEVSNVIFINARAEWVIPRNRNDEIRLRGRLKGKRKTEETDVIKGIIANRVETVDGKTYKIINFNRNYNDYLSAYNNGIKIITGWYIIGTKATNYRLYGEIEGEIRKINGRIIRQQGNYITLDDGNIYFVKWNETCFDDQKEVLNEISDLLDREDVIWEVFGGKRVKPRI